MLGIGLMAGAVAWAAKDPVIMTVNGVDVPKSEFEYLYHKNSQQQLEQQTLDEYAEIFKVYKLKVADALAQGVDTTAAFIREYEGYRADLAAPYLTDSVELRKLAHEAYDRMAIEPEAIHIMFFKTPVEADNLANRARLDSIRNEVLSGADFAELANKFSQDPGSNQSGGRIGYIPSPRYPFTFETTVYNTPEGEISEIVESPVGYHLIKGGKKRAAHGKVLAKHIMVSTQSVDAETAKNKIDSIATLLKVDPSRFEALAMELSDDKGSARNGGQLPLFGTGDMVPEFQEAAFALADGEISEPVKSKFGWHIIKRISSTPVPTYAEAEPMIIAQITHPREERSTILADRFTKKLAKEFKGKENAANMKKIRAAVKANGLDSVALAQYRQDWTTIPVYTYGNKKTLTGGDLLRYLDKRPLKDPGLATEALEKGYNKMLNDSLKAYKIARLEDEEPAYRNLLHEFRDGSLLYEVGRQKVWDKASKDTEGLEKYFKAHRGDYKWKEPKVKGFLVQATTDSVRQAIEARLKTLPADSVVRTIRKEFAGQVQIDRVLVSKGSNALIDYLMFDGEKATPSNSKYTEFFLHDARILTEPEEAADVRGLVTSDYQNELEREWVDDLKARYPVVVYEKVLRTVK